MSAAASSTANDSGADAGGSIMSVSSGSSASAGWSTCADQYHRWAEHVTGPHALWMLERAMELDVVSQPKKRLEVLDLACGDGVLSLAAAERTDRVASVIASDYSAGMCAQLDRVLASRPASSPPLCPVRTLVADAQDLSSLATASVDLVLMGFGLMLVPDPARAVEEMRRVLRPGGVPGAGELGHQQEPAVWIHGAARCARAPQGRGTGGRQHWRQRGR